MLLEFKVGNFQCFREEQTLSMIPAGKDTKLRGNLFQGHRTKTTKAAAIFGHNASGKTSFLHALHTMRRFVISSATKMNQGDWIAGIVPFRLASATREAPSSFEITVEVEGNQYRYRIETTAESVVREFLHYQAAKKASRWITLIDRDMTRENPAEQIKLHELIGDSARRTGIQSDTRDNGLVLSRAAERNAEIVHPLLEWFQNKLQFISMPGLTDRPMLLLGKATKKAADDKVFLKLINQFIQDADTGICQITPEKRNFSTSDVYENEKLGSAQTEEFASLIDRLFKPFAKETSVSGSLLQSHVFSTFHRDSESDEFVPFSINDESSGTIRFLALAADLLMSAEHGDLLIIDELDSSLHPSLARRLIQLIQSPEFNTSGAQLIFSTHDTTLMDANLLRRDQIWLTEKNPAGESELFSLWDIKDMPPPRGNTALATNYLAGRYGGAPTFGPTLEDIPQADEPTKIEVE